MAVLSKFHQLPAGLWATVYVNATPVTLESRGTISCADIVGFDEAVPSGIVGDVYEAYQPYLKVVNGCVPFPGVDAAGDTNAGLAPTGATNGDCDSSTGQIYVRGTTYGNYYAVMYSWHMPKDEPSSGLGHHHDWEGVVVWLTSSSAINSDNIVPVCPSAHGDWDCSIDGYTLSGTGALIQYENIWSLDHSCGLVTVIGESLTDAAVEALDTTDFGSANVPFNKDHFETNLAACSWWRKEESGEGAAGVKRKELW